MPPKIKITRDSIIDAALQLIREEGADALSTRTIARRLDCSTQPIFSNFPNMDALQKAVIGRVYELYAERTFAAMNSEKYPPYKASGMAYIEFAVEEPQLFKMMFMRDRRGETVVDDTPESEQIIDMMMKNTGLDSERAHQLHAALWVQVHGLAVLFATGYETYNETTASGMLTDVYLGLLARMKEKGRKEQTDDRNQTEIPD